MKRITREEWAALSDAEQAKYIEVGDGYVAGAELVSAYSTLKESLDAKDKKLQEKDTAISQLTQQHKDLSSKLEGLGDLDEVREALAKKREQEGKELIDKGEYQKALDGEKARHKTELEKERARFEAERKFTETYLIDNTLSRALSTRVGEGADAIEVFPHLREPLEHLIRNKFKPKVTEKPDGTREAVVEVNGLEQPLASWAQDWLKGDEAKHWVQGPESSGGHQSNVKPSQVSSNGQKRILSSDKEGIAAHIADIAKGEMVVVDG